MPRKPRQHPDYTAGLNRPGQLYATMHPHGLWTEPCTVICPCGWELTVDTCQAAQQLVTAHNIEHWKRATTQKGP